MKTIKQWFETFEDAEIRKRALDNMVEEWGSVEQKGIRSSLLGGFDWANTKEGVGYWKKIYTTTNPASVKFNEVKHLIKND